MKFLSESAAFSSINVSVTPDAVAQPIEVQRWLPFEVAEAATEALLAGLQGVANLIIWVAIFIVPMALLVGAPLWFLVRWFLRRRRDRLNLNEVAVATTSE